MPQKKIEVNDHDIHQLLVRKYKNIGYVLEGWSEGKLFKCQVRCGVSGNPDNKSQLLCFITVDKNTGVVTEENVISGKTYQYNLFL